MRKSAKMKEILLSFVLSIAVISFLVFHGDYERIALVLMSIFLFSFIKNWRKIDGNYIFRILVGMLMGIAISYFVLMNIPINQEIEEQLDGLRNHENTAVLLVFGGEPEQYNAALILENLREEMTGIGQLRIPFRLYQYKRAYEEFGISRYEERAKLLQGRLNKLLSPHYDVYISYVHTVPYYHEVMDQIILKENYNKVIIQPISVGESLEEIAKGNGKIMPYLVRSKATVRYADPLWNSEKLGKAVVKRIIESNYDNNVNDVGIILIGGKKDDSTDAEVRSRNTRREMLFMERIKESLILQGIEDRKIIDLNMVDGEGSIRDAIDQLRLYGVGKIYLASIHDLEENIENKSCIIKLLRKVEYDQDIELVYIEGWGVDELVVEELENRIRLLNVQE